MKTNILWASAADLPRNWPLYEHSHNFYHLFYFIDGNGIFMLNGEKYQISPGFCVIAGPGIRHGIPADLHSETKDLEVKFQIFDPELEKVVNNWNPAIVENPAFIEQMLRNIVYYMIKQGRESLEVLDLIMTTLLLSLPLLPHVAEINISKFIDTSPYNELARKVFSYIEAHQFENFSLDEMASSIGHNKNYVCSAFKKATGITVIDYLNHIRIRNAAFCLYYHDIPISHVAEHVGFSSLAYFSKVFKKLTGISPRQFTSLFTLSNSNLYQFDNPYSRYFDENIGVRNLPLDISIANLRSLGYIADGTLPLDENYNHPQPFIDMTSQ